MTRQWDRDTQKHAVSAWISFLTAAFMSLVFFAFIDPLLIIDHLNHPALHSREVGYAVVFFFFWSGTAISCWLSLRLTRRKRQQPRPAGTPPS